MSRSVSDSLVGKRVGAYTVKRLLGRGATADVYAGIASDGSKVALKVLANGCERDEELVTRFAREVRSIRRLEHVSIVKLIRDGKYGKRPYIAMELMHGGSFRRLLTARRRRPRQVVEALAQVADALAFAHEQGVVHRDLKPENVLLKRNYKAKVSDFGTARDSNNSMTLTTDGRMMGTACYLSPEQARGQPVSPASDVYSLGVMIYEAIAGELPFSSDNPFGFVFQHAEVKPKKPRARRGFDKSLERVAMRCLAKEPERRPTATDVANDLRASLRARPLWRRVRLAAIVTAAAAVVAAAALVAFPPALDRACRDGSGSNAACAIQRAARTVHDTLALP